MQYHLRGWFAKRNLQIMYIFRLKAIQILLLLALGLPNKCANFMIQWYSHNWIDFYLMSFWFCFWFWFCFYFREIQRTLFIHTGGLFTILEFYLLYWRFIYYIGGLFTILEVYILYWRFIYYIGGLFTILEVYLLYWRCSDIHLVGWFIPMDGFRYPSRRFIYSSGVIQISIQEVLYHINRGNQISILQAYK